MPLAAPFDCETDNKGIGCAEHIVIKSNGIAGLLKNNHCKAP
jgi:hypothetical protein